MRLRNSSLISLSFAHMRSRRVFRLIWNFPARFLPQMKVRPRKLKVSGLPSPRRLRGAIYGRACPSRKMVKRKERKMAEQYVEQLAAARERIVADRRELADELAKPYERGRYEQWRRIIEVQATIDAIDRAITDERSIKDKGKPVSLVDLE